MRDGMHPRVEAARRAAGILLVLSGLPVVAITLRCMLMLSGDHWVGSTRPYLTCAGIGATVALGGVMLALREGRPRNVCTVLFAVSALLTSAETFRVMLFLGWGS